MRPRLLATAALAAALSPLAGSDPAAGAAAKPFGSGAFGAWGPVDRFGLPAYRYAIDEATRPARRPAASSRGRTDAWHQVGNDHIVANAYNHGYVQLWSQDRRYQWANRYDAADRATTRAASASCASADARSARCYDDRPAGARTGRDFGVGYVAGG